MKWIVLFALVVLISGCAAPLPLQEARSCDTATFVASRIVYPVCKREVCRGSRVELEDELGALAAVDDWAEERFCALRPLACLQAYRLKEQSERWVKSLTGRHWSKNDVRYGPGDAARHAHLMCLLAERFGPVFARELGIAHEDDSGYLVFSRMGAPSNHCCERYMDLHNNEIGIGLAGQPGVCEDKVLASMHLLRHSTCPRERGPDYAE